MNVHDQMTVYLREKKRRGAADTVYAVGSDIVHHVGAGIKAIIDPFWFTHSPRQHRLQRCR